MAYAALAALLEAAPDWIQADGSAPKGGDPQGKQRRELLVTESNTMTALVDNSLGMPAQMLLDWGDHQVRAAALFFFTHHTQAGEECAARSCPRGPPDPHSGPRQPGPPARAMPWRNARSTTARSSGRSTRNWAVGIGAAPLPWNLSPMLGTNEPGFKGTPVVSQSPQVLVTVSNRYTLPQGIKPVSVPLVGGTEAQCQGHSRPQHPQVLLRLEPP